MPYDRDGKLISLSIIKNEYPYSYNYLMECEKKLKSREGGKPSKHAHWYSFRRLHGINEF